MTRRGVQRTEKLVVPERASKASCIKVISWAMGKKWGHEGRKAFPMESSVKKNDEGGKVQIFNGEQVYLKVIDMFTQH